MPAFLCHCNASNVLYFQMRLHSVLHFHKHLEKRGRLLPYFFFSFLDFTDPILTTPGRDHEAETKPATFYTELWFVVLMAILGLVFLAVLLSLILQCKISKQPYARERPPLVPLQKRMSPMTVYSQGETHMV